MDKLKVGKIAPSFSLLNQDGKKISLKDYRGEMSIVLYFYPRALTPGCTTQACGIRDSKVQFQKLNTVVLGVSPDTVPKLKKFQMEKQLNFDLLADEDKVIAKKYGVWGQKKFMGKIFMGVIRTTFIIGVDGKIKSIIENVKTKSHHEDVLSLLPSLI